MPKGVFIRKPFSKEHCKNISIGKLKWYKIHKSHRLGKKATEETKRKMCQHSYMKGKFREKNPNWKGGRYTHSKGYIYIYKTNHPYSHNGYIYEHRLIIEKYLGRYLKPFEQSHHVNSIKNDNRPKNLMAFVNNSAHKRFHNNQNNVKPKEIIFDGRKL